MRTIANHVQATILRGIAECAGILPADRQKPMLVIEEIVSTDWASATFLGATHDFSLRLDGEAAPVAAALARLAADLCEHDITIPGHIVAEIVLQPLSGLDVDQAIVSQHFTVNALTIID